MIASPPRKLLDDGEQEIQDNMLSSQLKTNQISVNEQLNSDHSNGDSMKPLTRPRDSIIEENILPLGTCKYKSYRFPSPSGGLTNKKIFLLKTPKTGGSTFAGILRGVADNYNLTTLYPETNFLTFKKMSEIESCAKASNITIDQIDILCNHMDYNTEIIRQILGPNYYRVALFRDPVSRALSGYYHSRRFNVFCSDFSLEDWPHYCSSFHDGLGPWFKDRANMSYFNYLQTVQEFDHIVLSNYYTESLLVFMHKMNLRITDLLHVSSKQGKIPDDELLTEEQITQFTSVIEKKNSLDSKVYQYVYDRLMSEYESLPEHYSELRKIFEEMLKDVQTVCSNEEDFKDCYWFDNGCAKTCIKNWIKENVECNE